MPMTRLLLMFAVGAGLTSLSACEMTPTTLPTDEPRYAADIAVSSTDPASAAPANPGSVQAITSAATPSDAVAAYSAAIASHAADSGEVQQAYIRRMVDFGLPLMAETQAQNLVRQQPQNGLALGVLAFANGRRGENSTALDQIAAAIRSSPRDPFVETTAAQLLAWYDTSGQTANLPASAKYSAQYVRDSQKDLPIFADAYREARDRLSNPPAQAAGPGPQPMGPPSTQPSAPTTAGAADHYSSGDLYDYTNGSDIMIAPPPSPYTVAPPPVYSSPYVYDYYESPYTYPYIYQPIYPGAYYDFGLGFGYRYRYGSLFHRYDGRRDFDRFDSHRVHDLGGYRDGRGRVHDLGGMRDTRDRSRPSYGDRGRDYDRSVRVAPRSGQVQPRGETAPRRSAPQASRRRSDDDGGRGFVGPMPMRPSAPPANRGSAGAGSRGR